MEAEKLKLLSKLKKLNESILIEIDRADDVQKKQKIDWNGYLIHSLLIIFIICFVFKNTRIDH